MMLGGLIFLAGDIVNGVVVHVSKLIVGHFPLGISVGFGNQGHIHHLLQPGGQPLQLLLCQNRRQPGLAAQPRPEAIILVSSFFLADTLGPRLGFWSNGVVADYRPVNVGARFASAYTAKDGEGEVCAFPEEFKCLSSVPALIGVKYGVKGDQIEVVVCICIDVAGFVRWSTTGWLYPREIFELEVVRSSGKSTTVAVNMLFTFIVAQTFLRMLCFMKFGSFIFLAFFVVVMTLYCY
ncbi:UNVERIFIED_CONTAM: Sugar transport protein 12 [Sesamum latifolium]|uniref:Sugar transport protein 12 n=1 Tax=Sesamum latifolium TaxID=2727402 RepID=A0AAW2U3X2_9LAMI